MIDHIGITVGDFQASKQFYAKALAPIGYSLVMEVSAEQTGNNAAAGFGVPPKPDFWIAGGGSQRPTGPCRVPRFEPCACHSLPRRRARRRRS